MDAADPAHDRRRLPRLPARRLLQPRRCAHRPGDPARRDDDRGGGHAVDQRPRPGPAERPLRDGRRRRPARGLPPGARTASSPSGPGTVLGESIDLLDRIADHARRPARRDRRRHLRADEAPGRRRAVGSRASRRSRRRTSTRPPRSWRAETWFRHDRPPRASGCCVPTATPPATGWCSCPSRCRCRTPRWPRGPPSSWPTRWAWTRRWSCTPSRWGPTSPSSSSTAG